jgi:hypothetical protein
MEQLVPMEGQGPFHSAVPDSLDPVYDGTSGLVYREAKLCIESFDIISVTGSPSYLT